MDEELDEALHVLLVVDHEVDLAVGQDQGDAVPGVERDVLLVVRVLQVDMLTQHPES